jgi:hypothetical protein
LVLASIVRSDRLTLFSFFFFFLFFSVFFKVRSVVLDKETIAQEDMENLAYLNLQRFRCFGCCCSMLFETFVMADRHHLETDGLHLRENCCCAMVCQEHVKRGLIYFWMLLYVFFCAGYTVLFGFCHGQETTLAWLQSIAIQLVVSALLVRPLSIFMMSGFLPSFVIQIGLSNSNAVDDVAVATQVEVELASRGERVQSTSAKETTMLTLTKVVSIETCMGKGRLVCLRHDGTHVVKLPWNADVYFAPRFENQPTYDQIRAALLRMYMEHAPGKMSSVGALIAHFQMEHGSENAWKELCATCKSTYCTDLREHVLFVEV